MRVAFLSVSSEMGGSEVSLLEAVRGLRRTMPGWRLDVIVPREGPLSDAVAQAGAGVHVLPLPNAIARIGESAHGMRALAGRGAALLRAAGSAAAYGRRLAGLLSQLRPDIVHSNGLKMHVLGARAVPRGASLVWHIHEYVGRRSLTRTLLRRYGSRCAAIIANSRSVAADVSAALSGAVPVTTIYNAVDPREFSPDGNTLDLDALSGLPPCAAGSLRIGLVGTYGRWKGHSTFVEAVGRLRLSQPWRAYIVGGPLYDTHGSQYTRAELEKMVADAGLEGRIGLTGFVRRPSAALRAIDIVVHASTEPEPFGLVIAEGLAAGRAVVVSNAGGAAELVTDGVDALTYSPADAVALAGCMTRLAEDASLRRRLGNEGRRSALSRFAPDEFVRQLVSVYEEARGASHHVSH